MTLLGTFKKIIGANKAKKVGCTNYFCSQLYLFLLALLFTNLFIAPKAYANGSNNINVSNINNFNNQHLQQLAQHQQWQHLLFYKNGKAEVISNTFYLSLKDINDKKQFSPYKELVETLKQSNNIQVVCKYPARYYWLKSKLPMLNIDLTACPNVPSAKQDISLILVSNYLKNPASSFGHVLIKTSEQPFIPHLYDSLNNQVVKNASSQDLLNQSYNFGARVPTNESSVLYAIKGLFGFYDSGFSRADFFKQDAVYSKHEQRDMWEYVLNLNEFNTALLNYHLYEAQSARFSYYFIKQNCGYRSGEILELIKDDIKTTDRIGSWYAPDFVFDQLVEYKQVEQNSSLVKQIRYLPSEQTQLRQKFVQLSAPLQNSINRFIQTEDITALSYLMEQDKTVALDFLLTHRNYKISQEGDEQKKTHHEMVKKQLISARFELPEDNRFNEMPLSFKQSPALSNKTTRTGLAISEQNLNIELTLFSKDPLNTYTDINKHFEAIKLETNYNFNEQDLTFNEFVFLEMQQIEDLYQPLAGEPSLSWQVKTGVEVDPIKKESKMTYVTGGIGAGIDLSDKLANDHTALGYGFINAHLHDQKNYVDISTHLGIRIKDDEKKRAAAIEYTIRKRDALSLTQSTSITVRQEINKNNDARITLSYEDNNNTLYTDKEGLSTKLTLNHYW